MADTYEKNLAQKSSLTTSDYIRVVGTDNVSYKQPVSSVMQTMGVDALNSNTEITGITAGSNISNLEASNIFKTGRMVTGNIIFRADTDIDATSAIIASGLPYTNYRRQVNGICIGGSLVGQSTRFAVYQGNLTTYWSNSVPSGTTWNVTFAYPV